MVNKVRPPPCKCPVEVETSLRRPTFLAHMVTASSVEEMKIICQDRFKINKDQITIVLMTFTHYRNGKRNDECPKYNSVYRFSKDEKLVVFCFYRPKHICRYALWVRNATLTDQFPKHKAAMMFHRITELLGNHAVPIRRGCSSNYSKTCKCQGYETETCGATYNYGCAFSERNQGCKYKKSKNVNKFHLIDKGGCNKDANEKEIAGICNSVVDLTSQKLALGWPETFKSQVEMGKDAPSCRLGSDPTKCPYSSFTCCIDFSCHVHLDVNNVGDDVTGVYTMTRHGSSAYGRHRNSRIPNDEQFHVLASFRPYFANDQDLHQKLAEGRINVIDIRALKGKAAETSGGIAIALPHNSLSFECARHDHHATTFLRNPNRKDPTRISMVYYLAKNLTKPNHGYLPGESSGRCCCSNKSISCQEMRIIILIIEFDGDCDNDEEDVAIDQSDTPPMQIVTDMDLPACKNAS